MESIGPYIQADADGDIAGPLMPVRRWKRVRQLQLKGVQLC